MIEFGMYIGIGFLLGLFVSLPFIALVDRRAVRLTTKRLSVVPPSVAEIGVAKDLMRAEFAMSTRRLEVQMWRLNARCVDQFAEIARKDQEIRRQKVHIATLVNKLNVLERHLKFRADEFLLVAEDRSAKRPRAMEETKGKLSQNSRSLLAAKTKRSGKEIAESGALGKLLA
jgi:hypothetical protein